VQRDSVRRQEAAQNQAVVELVQTLTPREREVMDAVVTGKMNKQTAHPPMIFMTSFEDDRTRNAAMEGGAFAFLGKPVDVTKLLDHLEHALRS
jgi:FixJ family two-component response regulator